jgi:thiamine-phosphate pyrophosphorylase
LGTSSTFQRAALFDRRPLFYYITDRNQLSGISLIACIQRAVNWGVDFVQIREKDLPDRQLFEVARHGVSLSRGTKCRILVNGRADIALAAGAHGVHLPSKGLNASEIRAWTPKGFLIGVSVHTEQEIADACSQSADYVLLGHVFPTVSKSNYGPSLGLDFLQKVCSQTPMPVFALGGMRPDLIGAVLATGAAGVAGISVFQMKAEFTRLKKRSKVCK